MWTSSGKDENHHRTATVLQTSLATFVLFFKQACPVHATWPVITPTTPPTIWRNTNSSHQLTSPPDIEAHLGPQNSSLFYYYLRSGQKRNEKTASRSLLAQTECVQECLGHMQSNWGRVQHTFNTNLRPGKVLTYAKTPCFIQAQKKSHASDMNDFRLIILTFDIMNPGKAAATFSKPSGPSFSRPTSICLSNEGVCRRCYSLSAVGTTLIWFRIVVLSESHSLISLILSNYPTLHSEVNWLRWLNILDNGLSYWETTVCQGVLIEDNGQQLFLSSNSILFTHPYYNTAARRWW